MMDTFCITSVIAGTALTLPYGIIFAVMLVIIIPVARRSRT